jgi:hypothetical protein
MATPDTFGLSTVATVLRRERGLFEDNARHCCDPPQIDRYEQIIAEFNETIAHVETLIATASRPKHLAEVA